MKYVGDLEFLSNAFPASVYVDGIKYPSVAHAYNAMKTHDVTLRREISKLTTPREAHVAGRKLDVRADWSRISKDVMLDLLRKKFENIFLAHKLVEISDCSICNDWVGSLLKLVRNEIISRGTD